MYCVDIGMGIACRGVFGWGETIYERSKWNEGRVFVFDVGPGREVEDRDTRGEGIYKEGKRRRVVWSWELVRGRGMDVQASTRDCGYGVGNSLPARPEWVYPG